MTMDLGVAMGSELDLAMHGDRIVISKPSPSLDALLQQITPENLHGETDIGDSVGQEQW
jgi:antitoxin MazE